MESSGVESESFLVNMAVYIGLALAFVLALLVLAILRFF